MLDHGGAIRKAAEQYGVPLEAWLDLSIGINPNGWPVGNIPPEAWLRLPETEDGLERVALQYYGASHLLPVAGSQAAIQALPHLRAQCRVGIFKPSYAEHAHAWQRAGHEVGTWKTLEEAQCFDVVIVANPNNPTGTFYSAEELLALHATLSDKGGWLIVDEAFIDAYEEDTALMPQTLSANCERDGLIVLRSLGKFFGLAGARVGFVLAPQGLCDKLREWLGPWTISGPSRQVAKEALDDVGWQKETRQRLAQSAERLGNLLIQYGLHVEGKTALFQWVKTEEAVELHDQLARRGILVRLFHLPLSLRFGLPGSTEGWERLENALSEVTQ
jgi:cobalamin biosynthetic protein CobC